MTIVSDFQGVALPLRNIWDGQFLLYKLLQKFNSSNREVLQHLYHYLNDYYHILEVLLKPSFLLFTNFVRANRKPIDMKIFKSILVVLLLIGNYYCSLGQHFNLEPVFYANSTIGQSQTRGVLYVFTGKEYEGRPRWCPRFQNWSGYIERARINSQDYRHLRTMNTIRILSSNRFGIVVFKVLLIITLVMVSLMLWLVVWLVL